MTSIRQLVRRLLRRVDDRQGRLTPRPGATSPRDTSAETDGDPPAAPRARGEPSGTPTLTRRRFVTSLPVPTGAAPLPPLVIDAPPAYYVPQRLQEVGLAGYEPDTLAAWCAALQLRPAGRVYDVGANIGVFALTAALLVREGLAPRHHIIAVEPTPDLVAVARQLTARNQLDIELLEVCFGREDGTATFHLSDQSDASSSLNARFRPSSHKLEVPVVRLDSVVPADGLLPTLLKVDTESTEPDVLEGGRAILERSRPWIVCEVLPDRGAEGRLQPFLDELGYRTYRLDGRGAASERPLAGDAGYEYLNWLFTPEDPDEDFWRTAAQWRTAFATAGPGPLIPGPG